MKKRLATSAVFICVIALAFVLKMFVSNYFFDAMLLPVACFLGYEMSRIMTKMGRSNDKILSTFFPCVLMLIILLCIASDASIGLVYTIIISVACIVVFFGIAFAIPLITPKTTRFEMKTRKIDKQVSLVKYSLTKALNTAVVLVYPSFLILFLTYINHFEDMSTTFSSLSGFNNWISFFVLLFALLIPIFTDTFAYLMGGLFGGKKLAPKISPNKTISGAVGGLFWCVLLSTVVFMILNSIPTISNVFLGSGITVWKVVIIAFIGSILSQCGDLFESWLKRNAGVKDSGNALPGHGGFLDRFDSYMFVAPFIFASFSILFAVL